jgi:hypothetical protein
MSALRSLATEKTRAHRAQFIGTNLDAVTLQTPPALAASGRTSAMTDNFLPIELAASIPANQLLRVRIVGIAPENTLLASTVPSAHSQNDPRSSSGLQPSEPILETAF